MNGLTANYCSQIDRNFTFNGMLAATGQPLAAAKPDWDALIAEGFIKEIKGAGQAYYRWIDKPVSLGYKKLSTARLARVKAAIELNPGRRVREMLSITGLPETTLRRLYKMLQDAGQIESRNCRYWLTGKVPEGDAKVYGKARIETIWEKIKANPGQRWNAYLPGGATRRLVYHCLFALVTAGYVTRENKCYYPTRQDDLPASLTTTARGVRCR